MNILTIIIIAIIVIFTIRGARRGLVRMLISLARLIAVFLLGWVLATPISRILIEHTGLYDGLLEKFSGAEMPAMFVVKGISFLIAVVILGIAVFIVGRIVQAVASLPVIRTVNHVLGFLIGLVEGFIIAWLILYLIQIFATFAQADGVLAMIDNSRVLSLLAENNPFKAML